ncbi:MAG: hypothetical protein CO025_07445 [Ignavibacteria bacterium CG_4_9_14_0_2_um_filter_37_13]|nr:MAG: hypothetical protein CO025_07445 [Ignavibacteria bacterium CG_4_9_14_0_2_um_filter_37_13]
MAGRVRANIKAGMLVAIVLKEDQRTGELTEGLVNKSRYFSTVFLLSCSCFASSCKETSPPI